MPVIAENLFYFSFYRDCLFIQLIENQLDIDMCLIKYYFIIYLLSEWQIIY